MSFPFNKALKVAEYIVTQLRPDCNRIHIAGSIRRLVPEVKDIEIVCEPKKEFIQTGLFPDSGEWMIEKGFSESLATLQKEIVKGNINGRYMQMITSSTICPDIKLDLFMPAPDDYWRQFAIRTGSGEYSHHVIAAAWKKKGWVGVPEIGLRKISECDIHLDGQQKKVYTLKKCIHEFTLPPVWQTEGEFFTWLGLDYIDPQLREFNNAVNETL
jgi:DNA polymerase/3'-5' exonuclease PolX